MNGDKNWRNKVNIAVIDASTALAWVMLDEGLMEQADRLMQAATRQEVRLIAPSLWPYEIIRGLRRAAARGRTDPSSAWHYLQQILAAGVTVYSAGTVIERAWWIAASGKINTYDACYLALAQAIGCVCITADQKLVKAAPADLVRWIGDYE